MVKLVNLLLSNKHSLQHIDIDLFAVLCPAGPLKLLISIAEERDEIIPALVYSAGMASFDEENDPVGGYRTKESNSSKRINWSSWLPFSSSSKGYTTIENEEEEEEEEVALREGVENSNLSVNEMSNMSEDHPPQPCSRRISRRHTEEEDDEDKELNAIKLGLGDFIFYSVLIGRAARTDAVTLCLCIFAILTVSWITIYVDISSLVLI
jgi:presenilin 1